MTKPTPGQIYAAGRDLNRTYRLPEKAALRRRLIACHGSERAEVIIQGDDRAANEDLARWNAMANR